MKNLSVSLLVLVSVVPLSMHASETPSRPLSKVDFSSKSLAELREYVRSGDDNRLTPRSKQSFDARVMHPEIFNELKNDVLARLGMPQFVQAQQLPVMSISFIVIRAVPAAAEQPTPGSFRPGPHGPFCFCSWTDSASSTEQAQPTQGAAQDDPTDTQEEESVSALAGVFQRLRARWSGQ